MAIAAISLEIDSCCVQLYVIDRKGGRTRWDDKTILLYSGGEQVAQAVFAGEGFSPPEPYFSGGKIHYFSQASMYGAVIDLLRNEKTGHIAWKPVSDPKEARDGDAFFYTGEEQA